MKSGASGSSSCRSCSAFAALAALAILATTGCTQLYVVSNNVNCKATRAGTQDDDRAGEASRERLSAAERLARTFASDIDCSGAVRSSATAPVVEE